MRGLYIHVPFCVKKCRYCDFYSLAARQDLVEPYVKSVIREAGAHEGLSFQTLYLGGGTPSLLGAEQLRTLIGGMRQSFDLSGLVEATIEVNPESATSELLEAAKDAGMNRVSIGVQSLADEELQSAGRVHNAVQAMEAIGLARKAGFKAISADVMVGLPGQTRVTLHKTLEALIETGIQHLSVYCLSLEEGTPLAADPPPNLPSDDQQAELFEQVSLFITGHGFLHYEISNFAIEGYECRHNLNYWRGGEYLGLGPAAASHLNGVRSRNRADLLRYLETPAELTEEIEQLDAREKAPEEAMLRLRLLREGVDCQALIARFGSDNVATLIGRLDSLAGEGMLVSDGTRYRLAPARILTSNPIFAAVVCP